MRKMITVGALAVACAIPVAASAQDAKNEVQGFGGLTFGNSSFGTGAASTFGGRVSVGLTPNLQAIGEAGRLADIKSPLFNLLDFTSVGLRVSAWYGEGGVRFLAARSSSVRPYGEATAGFARLNAGVSGFGDRTDAIVNAALNFINRTQPMLGVGGGVEVHRGPMTLDLGYRLKRISAGTTIASALNAGHPYNVNQLRLGVGFRF